MRYYSYIATVTKEQMNSILCGKYFYNGEDRFGAVFGSRADASCCAALRAYIHNNVIR